MRDIRIFCPKCGWGPDGGAYWQSTHCHTVWNTFDTVARCPGCGFQYRFTQCIEHRGGCEKESPHLDWYHVTGDIINELQHSENQDK